MIIDTNLRNIFKLVYIYLKINVAKITDFRKIYNSAIFFSGWNTVIPAQSTEFFYERILVQSYHIDASGSVIMPRGAQNPIHGFKYLS